jgi:hypothetical protein
MPVLTAQHKYFRSTSVHSCECCCLECVFSRLAARLTRMCGRSVVVLVLVRGAESEEKFK